MPGFLSCKSKSVLAKPLGHQCSWATISPGLGANSERIYAGTPKIDPRTGELVFFGDSVGGYFSNTIVYGFADDDGKLMRLERFEAPFSAMAHDFRHALVLGADGFGAGTKPIAPSRFLFKSRLFFLSNLIVRRTDAPSPAPAENLKE
jgi:hypothetical protein